MIDEALNPQIPLNVTIQNDLQLFYQRQFTSSQATRERRKMYMEWKRAGLIRPIGDEMSKLFDPNPARYNANDNWVLLNFFEFVWVRLVAELRAFNFSKKQIQVFADSMLSPNRKLASELPSMMENEWTGRKHLYEKVSLQRDVTPSETAFNFYMQKLQKAFQEISTFELYIIRAIKERSSLVFRATNETGLVMYFLEDRTEITTNFLNQMLAHSYITISFSSLIDDFLFEEKNSKWKHSFQLLSDKEAKVLSLLNKKDMKELTFHFEKDSKEVHKATIKKEEHANVKYDGKLILDMMRSGQYKRIQFSAINSNNVYIEKEEIVKL